MLPLYGPLAIHSYGFFITLGLLAFIFFVKKDERCIEYSIDKNIVTIIYVGFLGAFFGGKIIHYSLEPELSADWFDVVLPWHGGFSILGSIAGAVGCLLFYFSRVQKNVLRSLDCMAPHVPLLQSIGRIGCFFAGCCYGKNGHHVQLYSAAILFIIFLYLYKRKNEFTWDGKIFFLYIMPVSIERCIIDYWRAEQLFGFGQQIISHNQWFALLLFFLSSAWYTIFNICFSLKLKK